MGFFVAVAVSKASFLSWELNWVCNIRPVKGRQPTINQEVKIMLRKRKQWS